MQGRETKGSGPCALFVSGSSGQAPPVQRDQSGVSVYLPSSGRVDGPSSSLSRDCLDPCLQGLVPSLICSSGSLPAPLPCLPSLLGLLAKSLVCSKPQAGNWRSEISQALNLVQTSGSLLLGEKQETVNKAKIPEME